MEAMRGRRLPSLDTRRVLPSTLRNRLLDRAGDAGGARSAAEGTPARRGGGSKWWRCPLRAGPKCRQIKHWRAQRAQAKCPVTCRNSAHPLSSFLDNVVRAPGAAAGDARRRHFSPSPLFDQIDLGFRRRLKAIAWRPEQEPHRDQLSNFLQDIAVMRGLPGTG